MTRYYKYTRVRTNYRSTTYLLPSYNKYYYIEVDIIYLPRMNSYCKKTTTTTKIGVGRI